MRTFTQKPKAAQQTTSTKFTKPNCASSVQSRSVHAILHLQRTIGNQAVLRLLQTATKNVDASTASSASTRFTHDFSQIPAQTTTLSNTQPKLKVNAPGDQYEQEADRIADQVLRQKMPEEEVDQKVDIHASASQQAAEGEREVNEDIENRLSRSKGGGNPISDQVRVFVEPRMQFDFSKVRVHTDNEAARMNEALGARAFTHSRDIYFGVDQYNPQSIKGKRLLAHELTHVVQQSGVSLRKGIIQRDLMAPRFGNREWEDFSADLEIADPDELQRRIDFNTSQFRDQPDQLERAREILGISSEEQPGEDILKCLQRGKH